ncbi:hypothetical protein AYO21_05862 [Fonsecaea monophora]|uniref:UBC core domain-containing protein n=1 Tax=Fonsecaea monophora TaxID=254056 RepID=A0A177F9U8_9EURO|nr:hypothetical protein AYO21_05862 [Fonsecaea monophora]OAG39989.1 hypothetical protein AYO21_05862 [Fonsecaea monophora]
MKIFAGCYLIAGLVSSSALVAALDSQAHLTPDCTHPPYTIHLFSREPLVIYIADFLTSVEREHLLEASASAFTDSQTADQDGTQTLRSTRRSKSATASRDAVTRCIEERALLFQGYDTPRTHLEPLQLVRYHTNETYDLHTDWFTSPAQTTRSHGGNRLSSFFAYVKASADISGGGTTFPLLDVPKDERWCEYIDCDTPFDEGVTFLPIPGNAVFWASLRRLAKDHAALRTALPPNYLFPDADHGSAIQDDLSQLVICITGAEGTPYAEGLWRLHLKMPHDYPKSPPKATFQTRIYHPNVDPTTGAVCLETLKRDWDPKLTLKDILITISCLLIQPNPDSALNAAAGAQIQEDYDTFSTQARLMTRIHAPIPKHLSDAVQEAKRRGEESEQELKEKRSSRGTSAEDDTKENAPSLSSAVVKDATSGSKEKRALSEIALIDGDDTQQRSEEIEEPKRKSPKTTRMSTPDQTRAVPSSIASNHRSQQKSYGEPDQVAQNKENMHSEELAPKPMATRKTNTGAGKKKLPRVGIRRL